MQLRISKGNPGAGPPVRFGRRAVKREQTEDLIEGRIHMEATNTAIKRVAIKLVACALILSMTAVAKESKPATTSSQPEARQDHPAPKVAVLYGFASVADVLMLSEGPVKETCRRYKFPSSSMSAAKSTNTTPLTAEEEFKLSDEVTQELANGLSKKMPVTPSKMVSTEPPAR